jgi:hypothetical protein
MLAGKCVCQFWEHGVVNQKMNGGKVKKRKRNMKEGSERVIVCSVFSTSFFYSTLLQFCIFSSLHFASNSKFDNDLKTLSQ